MKKSKKPPIDWELVERVMLKSIRGKPTTFEEKAAYEDAYARDPKEYGLRHATVRGTEVERIRKEGVL